MTPALHARLAAVDPQGAAALRVSDRSRIVRALEVVTATGRPLAAWQRGAASPPLVDPASAERLVLDPDRAELHRRIAARAERMLEEGAVEEVAALAALGLDPELPAMKAIGVRELMALAAGTLSRAEALAAIATETRRYAKRQMTWFRNQMADWPRALPMLRRLTSRTYAPKRELMKQNSSRNRHAHRRGSPIGCRGKAGARKQALSGAFFIAVTLAFVAPAEVKARKGRGCRSGGAKCVPALSRGRPARCEG